MTAFRRTMMVLAIINVLFALLAAAVGSFADGGDIWSRLVISVLHPIAAIAIIFLVFVPRSNTALLFGITAILAINIISAIALASLIAAEVVKGDWPLPLVFAPIPTIAIIYAVLILRTHPSSDNANQPTET